MFLKGAEQLCFCCVLHPFTKVGNSRLHSTPTDYLSFYGNLLCAAMVNITSSFGGDNLLEYDTL